LIVVAHRPSALAGVDQVLVMRDGKVQMVGPKEEVLRKIRPTSPMPAHMKVVSDSERTSS
jgi:ATP-binding cassette subfamily C protein